MKKAAWFVFFSFLAVSCLNEPDCYLLNNNEIQFYFRILGFSGDAVSVRNIESPGLLPEVSFIPDTLTRFAFTLNPREKQTQLIFDQYDSTNSLLLTYDRKFQFVSEDCGERVIFSNLQVPEYTFDSVQVVNATPTRPSSLNVNIFRCPTTNLMGITFAALTHIERIDTISHKGEIGPVPLPVKDVTYLEVPVSAHRPFTNYQFDFGNGEIKKLYVTYRIIVGNLGHACGIKQFYTEMKIDTAQTDFTASAVSAAAISDPRVSNIAATK